MQKRKIEIANAKRLARAQSLELRHPNKVSEHKTSNATELKNISGKIAVR